MNPIKYIPEYKDFSLRLATQKPSAWGDIPSILPGLIKKFNIKTNSAIEFGVEYGYSTSALANIFTNVTGVDTFTGDIHAGFKGDIYRETLNYLSSYPNINLVQTKYQDFCKKHTNYYDFAHVDIVHTYEDTYACGEWCVNHADVIVFHDTMSFPEVLQACKDLAKNYNLEFYNYEGSYGLGILIKK
jgi:hypothetical protein